MTETQTAKISTTEKATVQCTCECGEATQSGKSLYRPGHDARHAGNVARLLVNTTDEAQRNALIASLPTPALRHKALAMATRLAEKATAKLLRSAGKGTNAEPVWTEAEPVKVGRWTYPARQFGTTTQRNASRDGSGEWLPYEAK